MSYVKLEGLGKIPFSNIRRPKPLMDVDPTPAPAKPDEGDRVLLTLLLCSACMCLQHWFDHSHGQVTVPGMWSKFLCHLPISQYILGCTLRGPILDENLYQKSCHANAVASTLWRSLIW